MNTLKNKSLLPVLLSFLLIACGGSDDKEGISAENKQRMDLALESLTQVLPIANTELPYSSPVSEFTSNKPFSFQAQGLPNWAAIDRQTGRILGTPSKHDGGTSEITLYLTMDKTTSSITTTLKVLPSGAYIESNAIGYYDQQFGGGERSLRNDLIGEIEGEVQFMQSHNVRPNSNFQRDAGDETKNIYSPRLVALRDALLFFTPTNVSEVTSIDAVISINNDIQAVIPMLHPNETYAADYNGVKEVVFSNRAWSTDLPWKLMKNGLSVRFIVNKHTDSEQSGFLTAADIDIGEATQVAFQSIRLGMLTHVDKRSGHYTLNNPVLAATDYFQTIPTSRVIMGSYADMQLDKVIIRSGVIYDDVSVTTGGYYSGDMRENVAKSQVSTGINLANFGITSNNMNQSYPHLFKQTTIHHAWGNYENGRMIHGLSGGNGIATLVDSRGNEASHEWGHGYGLGHYPGAGLTEDERFKAHHADSGWGLIAHRKRLRDNLTDNAESAELQPATFHLDGRIPYGRDAMSGGSGNTGFSAYTHHTAYSARIIQNHLERYPLPDTNYASGYKKWNEELGQYQEFNYPENDHRLAAKEIGIAVATILGGYDPNGTSAVIYPVFHGNYGNVFELPAPDLSLTENGALVDQCWVSISNALGEEKLVSIADKRHQNNSINQLHINVNAEFKPTLAVLNCRREGTDIELTRSVFDGEIPELPPVAIVGQEAEYKQLKAIELSALNDVFEEQAHADLVELTSHQKAMLDSYTAIDVEAYFSTTAYASYQEYTSTLAALEQLELLLAKLTKEGTSDPEQATKVRELLSNNAILATSITLPTEGTFIKGPRYFSAPTANNSIIAIDAETDAADWIFGSQGRIHSAAQPWKCLMPGSGGLVVDGCNTNNRSQLWLHTEQNTLKNQSSNQCIDFASHNSTLIMYGCHNNWNQQWSLPTLSDNKLLMLLDAPLLERLYELLTPNEVSD